MVIKLVKNTKDKKMRLLEGFVLRIGGYKLYLQIQIVIMHRRGSLLIVKRLPDIW